MKRKVKVLPKICEDIDKLLIDDSVAVWKGCSLQTTVQTSIYHSEKTKIYTENGQEFMVIPSEYKYYNWDSAARDYGSFRERMVLGVMHDNTRYYLDIDVILKSSGRDYKNYLRGFFYFLKLGIL